MPPWAPLSRQSRVDLVAYIKAFSPRWQSEQPGTRITIPTETPVTTASILSGRALFQKMECWKCHGPAGHGDGPSASTPDRQQGQSDPAVQFLDRVALQVRRHQRGLYRIFMTGLDGTPMPSFADNLKPEEAWDLVHFLRTLQPIQSPEATVWHAWLPRMPGSSGPIGPDVPDNESFALYQKEHPTYAHQAVSALAVAGGRTPA